jgi:type I restriction enzyme S subunit
MFAAKRSPSLLQDRINADFYAPLYTEIEARLNACGIDVVRLGHKLTKVFKGAFDLPASDYTTSGVPFIRVTQIAPGFLELGNTVFISHSTHTREHKTAVRPGHLLFAKGGAYRHTAAVPDSVPEANICQDLIGAVPATDLDSFFAQAFLSSRYGRPQLIRWQQGDAQPHLTNDSVKQVWLLFPHKDVQHYIGDKLRQAVRLRERARALECDFQKAISDTVPAVFGPIQENRKTSRAHAGVLDDRLNPGLFNPERLRIRTYLQEHGGRLVSAVATIETPVTSNYQLQDPYLGLDGISSSSSMLSVGTVADDEVTGTVRVLPEGPAFGKLRPYLNKVCYVPPELAGCFGSTELLCVRPLDGVSGWYLYGVLKLESTVRQLNPVSTGSTHPRVGREDVLEVMVPWHEDYSRLGTELATAQRCYFLAQRLTSAAKHLVEALIEGKVTEIELKDAHGNRDADRAILQRLTRNGIDAPNEPPLFPNLDDLYTALDVPADASLTMEARG